jgi:hypothetical protein
VAAGAGVGERSVGVLEGDAVGASLVGGALGVGAAVADAMTGSGAKALVGLAATRAGVGAGKGGKVGERCAACRALAEHPASAHTIQQIAAATFAGLLSITRLHFRSIPLIYATRIYGC